MFMTTEGTNNNQFSQNNDEELFERYKELQGKYEIFAEDFKEFLQKFKNIRTELLLIENELSKRGVLKDGIV